MSNWRKSFLAILVAAAASMTTAPALAWEDQGPALKSLPSGGLLLKDLPNTDSDIESLPGVRLNPQVRDSGSNCTQYDVTRYRHGFGNQTGTVSECNFGNFSISTVRGTSPGPYTGVPSPFPEGPPPGSGGFAPQPLY